MNAVFTKLNYIFFTLIYAVIFLLIFAHMAHLNYQPIFHEQTYTTFEE